VLVLDGRKKKGRKRAVVGEEADVRLLRGGGRETATTD
jgi:hypothetical protein